MKYGINFLAPKGEKLYFGKDRILDFISESKMLQEQLESDLEWIENIRKVKKVNIYRDDIYLEERIYPFLKLTYREFAEDKREKIPALIYCEQGR